MMKKRCFLALVALLSLNAYSQEHPADTLNLTLDECIRIALTDNPTIKVADMEIQRVDYSKKETLGQPVAVDSFRWVLQPYTRQTSDLF